MTIYQQQLPEPYPVIIENGKSMEEKKIVKWDVNYILVKLLILTL